MGSSSSPARLGTSFPPRPCETSFREPLGSSDRMETATFRSHFWKCCARVLSHSCRGGCPPHWPKTSRRRCHPAASPAAPHAIAHLIQLWQGSIIPVSEGTIEHNGDYAEQSGPFSCSHPHIDQRSPTATRAAATDPCLAPPPGPSIQVMRPEIARKEVS